MGARLVKFDFVPKENEQIEAIIRIPEEKRSVINGVVKDCHNNIVKDAVVKLYEIVGSGSSSTLKPITHTFTDECGQFLFGPLYSYKKYAIKVWFDDVKVREIVITPEGDNDCHRNKEECDEDKDEEDIEQEDRREAPYGRGRVGRFRRRPYREVEDEEEY